MVGPFADRLFRIAFVAAGVYNLAFGFWAAVWPLSFFHVLAVPAPRYPGIWACLGMVVGVYGLLYLHAARRVDSAWPIIAVGLLGKVLGPIGMVTSFGDDWPRRLAMLCIYNDVIWWLPFGLFLVCGTTLGRQLSRLAPLACVTVHLVAVGAMAVYLRPGTLAVAEIARRSTYIAEHAAAWSAGWGVWMLSAISLVGFYAWWGGHVAGSGERGAGSENAALINFLHKKGLAMTATVSVVIAWVGMVFDFTGEGMSVFVLSERAAGIFGRETHAQWDADRFVSLEQTITLVTAGAANSLYTLAGVILTILTPDLPRWVRGSMWTTWLAGLVMSVSAVVGSIAGMVASTAILFPLLIVWVGWMGARWRRA